MTVTTTPTTIESATKTVATAASTTAVTTVAATNATSTPIAKIVQRSRGRSDEIMQPIRKLIADGVCRKPPISAQQAITGALPPPPLSDHSSNSLPKQNYRASSITSSEDIVAIDDIDDDITTGSDSYGHVDSSTDEGKPFHRIIPLSVCV